MLKKDNQKGESIFALCLELRQT